MDIEAIKGDTEYYDMKAIRSNSPIDLTGANAKIWFSAKRHKKDLDADALISLNSVDHPAQVVFTDRPGGLFYVALLPANTTSIDEDSLLYDVQVREQDNRITTVQRGTLNLIRDITRSVT